MAGTRTSSSTLRGERANAKNVTYYISAYYSKAVFLNLLFIVIPPPRSFSKHFSSILPTSHEVLIP